MPTVLLPASAAAFAPRSPPTVVLGTKVEPWLTASLKRINRVKRPLNSVPQHTRCLTETLSSAAAIWTLCSIMLPKAPDSDLRKDANPLIEALFNYQLLHIEAYVVHVDLVLSHEVAYKLTPETIDALVEYHKDIYSIDIAANTWSWSEKEAQVKKLHQEFVQAINKFVYRTGAHALEGLEDEGAGELLSGRAEDVKGQIMNLFLPLLPPPPRVAEVVRPQPPLLPSSPAGDWWQPSVTTMSSASMSAAAAQYPAPVESWKVLSSSPGTVTTTADSNSSLWAAMGLNELQLPSPTPSYSQPYSSAYSSAAAVAASSAAYASAAPAYSASYYSAPNSTSTMNALPLPSVLAQQPCATSAGYNTFAGWTPYQDYGTIM